MQHAKIFFVIASVKFLMILSIHNYTQMSKTCKLRTVARKTVMEFEGVEDFIVPFVNYTKRFMVAPDKKLISCTLRKSMSQLAENIMCLLYDEQQYFANSQSLNDTWKDERKCEHDRSYLNPSETLLNDTDTVRFAFIRDPFQRFISFYLDKCVREQKCYNCGNNMTCVLKNFYWGLKKVQRRWDGREQPEYVEIHAAPLSWNCDFYKDLSKWQLIPIGSDKTERSSAITQTEKILRKQRVNETLVDMVVDGMKDGDTDHSTYKSAHRLEAERQIREDPYIREMLHKIYYFDYVVFPFNRDSLDLKFQDTSCTIPLP
ncbi:Carbohydrate sulfotransferase [Caenorhabditis elegans]|uniref:Carbohydrate sulfotransferase n=1 Tax=Caenorhabditis elegans TaxID=6239 RepID=O45581_CAEEL|nr:Carbohydrate sulfotransferase [Caenorhabditis elegans]CAB04492.2 Carbohydrate sulfotransferase [Caenorhabditis elegans]|eukprot:NP_493105.1 Uncharacterized protein CELE_F56H6.4 [Caenorhabditis elegans]